MLEKEEPRNKTLIRKIGVTGALGLGLGILVAGEIYLLRRQDRKLRDPLAERIGALLSDRPHKTNSLVIDHKLMLDLEKVGVIEPLESKPPKSALKKAPNETA